MTSTIATPHKSSENTGKSIALPSFTLPNDYNENNDRYELWSIRVPIDLDLKQALDDTSLVMHLTNDISSTTKKQRKSRKSIDGKKKKASQNNDGDAICTFQHDSKTHVLNEGHVTESNHFRVLLPDDKNADDEDESTNPLMRPFGTFSRHFNVTSDKNGDGDNDGLIEEEQRLAPSAENAPKLKDGVVFRAAYTPIAQVSGLKRRWNVPGASGAAKGGGVAYVPKQDDKTNDNDDDDDEEVMKSPKRSKVVVKDEAPGSAASEKEEKKRKKEEKKRHKKEKKAKKEKRKSKS